MNARYDLTLAGCTPEPIMGYLKGLGVIRLVAEQADSTAVAYWKGDQLHVRSSLGSEELLNFFMEEYCPSPILAPWNGGSGFWDNTAAGKALGKVEASTARRLELYRKTIAQVRQLIKESGVSKKGLKEKKELKADFIRRLRSVLPDEAVPWIDAVGVVVRGEARFAPLLGTGANDGNLDFTKNFMERLEAVIPFDRPDEGAVGARARGSRKFDSAHSHELLRAAIFAQGNPELVTAATGQFHPGGVGGPNATQGFEGNSLVNPWDYVLMIEGLVLLAGAAARRLGSDTAAKAVFPFTVLTTAAGLPTVAEKEAQTARAEVWLPSWDRPAGLAEIRHLFGEGRAQVGRQQARTGLDFARAVAGLGVDRGIQAFERYSLMQRNGLAYLATSLGRLTVKEQPYIHLVNRVIPWVNRLRGSENAAGLDRVLFQLGDAIFAYCEWGGPARLQQVLVGLGRLERTLASSPKLHDKVEPLQGLDSEWVAACSDDSPEYRLSTAIASIYEEKVGVLRLQLEAVEQRHWRYRWSGRSEQAVWGSGGLVRNMTAVLQRRLLEADRLGAKEVPLGAGVPAPLSDVEMFLNRQTDDQRMVDLIWGLSLVNWATLKGNPLKRSAASPVALERSYAVLKLLFLPKLDGPGNKEVRVRPEPAVLGRLRASDLQGAVEIAYRRLWATGLNPLGLGGRQRRQAPEYPEPHGGLERLSAALLIPIWDKKRLSEMVLRSAAPMKTE